jgi:propionyl-CoA synthetase
VVAIEGPLPPGCMQTVWRDDARFVNTYWKSIPGKLMYSTFDWGIRTPTATSSSWAAPTT